MMQRMASWTGSEDERRDRGSCASAPIDELAAAIPPWERDRTIKRPLPFYRVLQGTSCFMSKAGGPWRRWVTRRTLDFETCEGYEPGYTIFRSGEYLLRVWNKRVR